MKLIIVFTVLFVVCGGLVVAYSSDKSNNLSLDKGETESTDSLGSLSREVGRKVFLDPETGELSSNPDSSARINVDQTQIIGAPVSDTEFVQTQMPNGSVKVRLGNRFNKNLVARFDENGKLVVEHDESLPEN